MAAVFNVPRQSLPRAAIINFTQDDEHLDPDGDRIRECDLTSLCPLNHDDAGSASDTISGRLQPAPSVLYNTSNRRNVMLMVYKKSAWILPLRPITSVERI